MVSTFEKLCERMWFVQRRGETTEISEENTMHDFDKQRAAILSLIMTLRNKTRRAMTRTTQKSVLSFV